jgi:hypothetical protein
MTLRHLGSSLRTYAGGGEVHIYITFGSTSSTSLYVRNACVENLECWPPFPLVMNYGGFPFLPTPSPQDEDNIMAALKHSIRTCSISLIISSSLLKKLSTISEPFSELEELFLLYEYNVQLTLPSAFLWGHRLRTLHSTRIAFPSLPQLLLPSQDLVDLQLNKIPAVGYFPLEAFANALCWMTQLQTLSHHFLSLPAETTSACLHFQGTALFSRL